jgi:hypothetical protein
MRFHLNWVNRIRRVVHEGERAVRHRIRSFNFLRSSKNRKRKANGTLVGQFPETKRLTKGGRSSRSSSIRGTAAPKTESNGRLSMRCGRAPFAESLMW